MGTEKENKTININGDMVAPSEQKLVQINIARLPTGTLIDIPIHVFNGKKSGPTVLIHGDALIHLGR